jgi:hypothetical protein
MYKGTGETAEDSFPTSKQERVRLPNRDTMPSKPWEVPPGRGKGRQLSCSKESPGEAPKPLNTSQREAQ